MGRRRASIPSSTSLCLLLLFLSSLYTIIIRQTGKRSTISKSNKFYVVCKYDFLLFILSHCVHAFECIIHTNGIIIVSDPHLNVCLSKKKTGHISRIVNVKVQWTVKCTITNIIQTKWWRWFKFIVTAFLLWFYM